jgi:hypothetical protein
LVVEEHAVSSSSSSLPSPRSSLSPSFKRRRLVQWISPRFGPPCAQVDYKTVNQRKHEKKMPYFYLHTTH